MAHWFIMWRINVYNVCFCIFDFKITFCGVMVYSPEEVESLASRNETLAVFFFLLDI